MPDSASTLTSILAGLRHPVTPSGRRALAGLVVAALAFGACKEITGPTTEVEVDAPLAVTAGPTVIAITPVDGATGVATSVRPVLTFSEPMNLSTINGSTVGISPSSGGASVAAVITFHGGNRIRIDPASPLSAGTTYAVTLTTGITNASGTPMAANYVSSFTTVAPPADLTAPTVSSTSPVANASNVPVNTVVSATFSESMNASTVSGSSVTLAPSAGGGAVAASVAYTGGNNTVTLTPSSALAFGTSYTLTVSTAVKDVAGNAMTSSFTSSFSTAAAPDVTSPTVVSVTPTSGASGVSTTTSVSVTFSEAMASPTVTSSTFTLTPSSGGQAVPAVVSYNAGSNSATLAPSASLAYNTSYTIAVTSGATDAAGNGLTPFSSAFTTSVAPAVGAPTIISTSPTSGATGVSTGVSVLFQFSELMNLGTINNSTVTLAPSGGGANVAGELTFHGLNRVLLDPTSLLAAGTTYVFTVSTGVQDAEGVPFATSFTTTFTTAAPADNTAPTVVSVSPVNGATGVSTGTSVSVVFSEAMSSGTITGSNIYLAPSAGGAAVAATVGYNAGTTTATVTPSAPLTAGTGYTLTVSTAVKDVAGNSIAGTFNSSFTTLAAADVTSPSVVSVIPASGTAGVSTGATVTVNFSEPMNAATVTTASFTLTPTSGGSPISAGVSYNPGAASATLTPSASLAFNTSYTVAVTTTATDAAGNALNAFASSFTTVQAPVVPAPTVIAVTPANSATGVATSASVLFQFNETMNLSTINNSTFTLAPSGGGPNVAGELTFHGLNRVLFDPTGLLAAGTTYVVTIGTGVQNASGTPMASAFSSTFTTVAPVDNTAPTVSSVTPLAGSSDVAINAGVSVGFSESMNAASINTSTFTVKPTSGGAPVAANVVYNAGTATASLSPSSALAYGTSYTVGITTGATDVAGNPLVAFSSTFTTASAPDVTAPTVVTVQPAAGATGVSTGTSIVLSFSEAMKVSTITGSNISLALTSGGAVAGTVSYNALTNTATFAPSAPLAYNSGYTITANTAVQDAAGNALTSAFTSAFTTTSAPDVTAPVVTAVAPLDGASNVAIGTNVSVTFSEPMNAASISGTTVRLLPGGGGGAVTAVLSYDVASRTATLNPSADLAYASSYSVSATSGATDVAGNPLTAFSSTFTTTAAPDVGAPTVSAVSPLDGATNVAIATNVSVTFSEPMNAASITGTTVRLLPAGGGGAVTAVLSYDAPSRTATLNPSADLAYATSYSVSATNGATDLAGNPLTPFTSAFTTAAAPDVTAPSVSAVAPLNGATNVAIATNVSVTFSEPMNAASITAATVKLIASGGGTVPAALSYDAASRTATLNPSADLAYAGSYTVSATNGATDVAGNPLTAFSSTFSTAAAPDVTAPTVTAVSPLDGATNVAIGTNVSVTFSEPMAVGTITGTTVRLLAGSGGGVITTVLAYDAASRTATLNPSADLAYSTSYSVSATNGATDVAGNPLTAFTSTFTTAAAPDVTGPTVTAVSPLDAATNVAIATNVTVTFSEPMNAASITGTTVRLLAGGGGVVTAVLSYDVASRTATLNPSADLAYGSSYSVSVTNGATDAAGNPATAFNSTFSTLPPPDITAPTITSVQPINGATNVATSSSVAITFSEPMNASTVNGSSVTLALTAGGSVAGVVSYDVATRVATFTPSSALAAGTNYSVGVSTAVRDVAGNFLNSAFTSSFSTAAPPDVTAPTVTGSTPANRAGEVNVSSAIRVTFSEAINQASLSGSTFMLKEGPNATVVPGTRTYDAGTNTAIFTPAAPLKNYLNYSVVVTTGVSDVAGNPVQAPYTACFSPAAGAGTPAALDQDHWAGNDACGEVHLHIPLAVSGNTLTRAANCGTSNILCNLSALTEVGRAWLGGASCRPSQFGPPRLCEVEVVSLTGTVNGSAVSFTFTTDNGLTFTFNGAFAESPGQTYPWLSGTISGATMPATGITWERQP